MKERRSWRSFSLNMVFLCPTTDHKASESWWFGQKLTYFRLWTSKENVQKMQEMTRPLFVLCNSPVLSCDEALVFVQVCMYAAMCGCCIQQCSVFLSFMQGVWSEVLNEVLWSTSSWLTVCYQDNRVWQVLLAMIFWLKCLFLVTKIPEWSLLMFLVSKLPLSWCLCLCLCVAVFLYVQ